MTDPPPGGFMGGGSGGGGPGGPTPWHPPRDSFIWPEVVFGEINDITASPPIQPYGYENAPCYYPGVYADAQGRELVQFAGSVALTAPEGVIDALFFVTIRNMDTVVATLTLEPGDTEDFAFEAWGLPQESVWTLQARAWGPANCPSITAYAVTPEMLPYCHDPVGGSSGGPIGEP